jgi:hypothetical protein
MPGSISSHSAIFYSQTSISNLLEPRKLKKIRVNRLSPRKKEGEKKED